MQDPKEIEKSYETVDPWGYQKNPDDIVRAQTLVAISSIFCPSSVTGHLMKFDRLLDIGAGEGWITQIYPAFNREGYELSNQAASRFPDSVRRTIAPEGRYDLVTATGIMYAHYDYKLFMNMIRAHASNIVITCNIKEWEVPDVQTIGKEIFTAEFPYREYTQKLRVFRVSPS